MNFSIELPLGIRFNKILEIKNNLLKCTGFDSENNTYFT